MYIELGMFNYYFGELKQAWQHVTLLYLHNFVNTWVER